MISLSLKNRADAAKVLNLNENLAVRKSFLEKAFPESKIGGTPEKPGSTFVGKVQLVTVL